jgi:hypothetical protein
MAGETPRALKTAYHVLISDNDGADWTLMLDNGAALVERASSRERVLIHLYERDLIEPDLQYNPIPVRNWRPLKLNLPPRPTVSAAV